MMGKVICKVKFLFTSFFILWWYVSGFVDDALY